MKLLVKLSIALLLLSRLSYTFAAPPRQAHILVYPFENHSPDKKYSWVSAGMTATLVSGLEQISGISVITDQDRRKAIEELKFTIGGLVEDEKQLKIGEFLAADLIFTGSYTVLDGKIRVIARLIQTEKGKGAKSVKLDGTMAGLFDLQDRIAFALMGEAEKVDLSDLKPVRLSEADKKKISSQQRPSLNAYELYAKGLEYQYINLKKALDYGKHAISADHNYLNALAITGWIANSTLNRFGEGLDYLKKVQKIYQNRDETQTIGYAAALNNIGSGYRDNSDLDQALNYYQKSKNIRENLGLEKTEGYSITMNGIGLIYKNKGDLDQALRYGQKSKNILENIDLEKSKYYAYTMGNIGIVYGQKNDLDQAIKYTEKSISIQENIDLENTLNYASSMSTIGILYGKKGDFDQALNYVHKSKNIRENLGLQNISSYATADV